MKSGEIMTPAQEECLEMLSRGPCVTSSYVRDYYGLTWPLSEDVRPDFEAWVKQLPRRPACPEGQVSRYELESFLLQKKLVSKKWMGACLGMQVSSLEALLTRLGDIGMRRQRYVVYEELISEALSEDLAPNLPRLRFRTFSDHNSFCKWLHSELHKILDINVQPLVCSTSVDIQEDPRQFASHFDCLTLEPLSGRHQLWLDFRKPLNLGPDRCSKLFYVENHDRLRPFCAGTREPADLEEYGRFLAGRNHG